MRIRSLTGIALASLPVLAAIWFVPWFVTQDGPAHAYTGSLIAQLLAGDAWLDDFFRVQLRPLPNLAGPLTSAVLSSFLPGRIPDKILMSATLLLFGIAVVVLRRAVRGENNVLFLVPFALVMSLNRLWLLGFYSFLLGATLFALTLAWWWRVRDDLNFSRAILLAILLMLGWFAHLVSFGATVIALAILSLAERSMRRIAWTAAGMLPPLPMIIWYGLVMHGQGGFEATYTRLDSTAVSDLLEYARSIKLFSIARQTYVPFAGITHPVAILIAPAVLFTAAFLIWTVSSIRQRALSKPWMVVAGCLLVAAIVAPDAPGMQHGGFLRERLFLLGMVAIVPAWSLSPGRATRAGFVLSLAGLVVQSAIVWDYAIRSHRQVAPLMSAAPHIPEQSRVYVIGTKQGGDFRAIPTLHAANLLGVGRRLVVWNNYQANLYFFPVSFRDPFLPCSEDGFCEIGENRERIDVVVMWGSDSARDSAVLPLFPRRIWAGDEVRVYGR